LSGFGVRDTVTKTCSLVVVFLGVSAVTLHISVDIFGSHTKRYEIFLFLSKVVLSLFQKQDNMILQIENLSSHDKSITEIFEFAKGNNYEALKLYVSIYHPSLMVGKGGSHIWIKDKANIDVRLAIIYF
jgi:hypothetical protein